MKRTQTARSGHSPAYDTNPEPGGPDCPEGCGCPIHTGPCPSGGQR